MSAVHALRPSGSSGAAARIGRNFSYRFVSQVLWAVINVGGLSLLGNYLHAEGYGRYAFYYALLPLIGALGDFGVGIIVTREMARAPQEGRRILGDALLLKAAISGTLFLLACVTAWVFFEPPVAWLIVLVAAAALTEIAQDPAIWLFRAHERQDVEAWLMVGSQVAWIAGLAACAWLRLPLAWLLGASTAAFALRVLVGAWLVPRLAYKPEFRFDAVRLAGYVREGLPYGLAMLGVVFHGRVAVLLLQALSSAKDVAWFNVAYMLSQPFGFVSTALTLSAFPVIARYAKESPERLRETLRKAAKYQVVVSLPLMTGMILLSERVIPLLFHGDDFAKAGTALKVTSFAMVFIFLNLMSRYVLAALGRQRLYLYAILAGLAVNAGTCFLLIPRFGYLGACIAYLGAETTIFAVCQIALNRHVDLPALLRESVRPRAAAAGMGVVVVLLQRTPLFVVVPAGAVAYGALLFVFRAVSPHELSLIQKIAASFRRRESAPLAASRVVVRPEVEAEA